MQRIMLITVAALVLPLELRADTELDKFQGKWTVEVMEENGVREPDADVKDFVITIAGSKMTMKLGERDETIDFKIDPKQTPKAIDMTPNYGTLRGKLSAGIYDLDGDRLHICARPGGERPKVFASEKGIVVMVLKRKKD